MADKEDVSEPEVSHCKKVPRRIGNGTAEGVPAANPEDYYRQLYFEVLYLALQAGSTRVYQNVKGLLWKAVKNEDYHTEFDFVTVPSQNSENSANGVMKQLQGEQCYTLRLDYVS